MSPLPDASEITVPKDPSAYRRRHLLGLTFWAMLVMELLCVLAGVAVADYGPRFFRPKPVPRSAIVTSATAETAAATPTPAAAPAPATTPNAPLPDVARLNARLDSLEAQQTHASQVAAAALAASAVVEAAQGTGPFADELLSLRAISAPLPELQALTRVAQAAAPSRTALATSFPDYAASAASAAR
jgi:hypothetical protein